MVIMVGNISGEHIGNDFGREHDHRNATAGMSRATDEVKPFDVGATVVGAHEDREFAIGRCAVECATPRATHIT